MTLHKIKYNVKNRKIITSKEKIYSINSMFFETSELIYNIKDFNSITLSSISDVIYIQCLDNKSIEKFKRKLKHIAEMITK